VRAEMAALGTEDEEETAPPGPEPSLPFARKDADRLRLILAAQSRLREVDGSPRVKQLLASRGYLEEALRWLEIHGGVQGQELATHWRRLELEPAPAASAGEASAAADGDSPRPSRSRRRRRRRPRRRPGSSSSTPVPSA